MRSFEEAESQMAAGNRYPGADCEKTQAPVSERDYNIATHCGTQAGRPYSSEEIVAEFFKYHAPTERTIPKYAAINQVAKNFAEVVLANCPPGTDRTTAIYSIRTARMIANAAISLNGLSL
jgi:hypothetical protein